MEEKTLKYEILKNYIKLESENVIIDKDRLLKLIEALEKSKGE